LIVPIIQTVNGHHNFRLWWGGGVHQWLGLGGWFTVGEQYRKLVINQTCMDISCIAAERNKHGKTDAIYD